MSIVTKTGDDGTTALMYGRRVPKNHPRVEACGAVDELNAALGMARATSEHSFIRDNLSAFQKDLIVLMGVLGVLPEDLPRYARDGFPLVTPAMTARLDALVKEVESQNHGPQGLGDAGGGPAKRGAGRGADGLPPRRAARMHAGGTGRAGESRNRGLSQPAGRFAVAAGAVGGGEMPFNRRAGLT